MVVMNGWKEAPHCWRQYWRVSRDDVPGCWVSWSFLGFTVFFLK
jgi:hypothetical protein